LALAMSLPLLGAASWAGGIHADQDVDSPSPARLIDPPAPASAAFPQSRVREDEGRRESADFGGSVFDPFTSEHRAAPAHERDRPGHGGAALAIIVATLGACAIAYLLRRVHAD
jgi:hypothetical protein